jgi:lipopolysaccharide/colanic/teichoic acid biosynthesis glycosyltransferase
MRGRLYRAAGKRLFDLTVASLALILLSPLIGLTSVAVLLFIGRPALFRQQRPGKDGKPFHILKFRTMTEKRDASGELLPDAERLTRFGKWLRATSLDELPELWNVLRGEMSLVGPRPLLMQYLPLYSPEQARRHEVLPGITGLAQISGRNELDFKDRFVADVHYVDNVSFALDLSILMKTIRQVVRAHGITQKGWATTDFFTGNQPRE